MRFMRGGVASAWLLLITLAVPGHAQYFGRNKVQYQTFDFAVLQTPHFDIYYYSRERAATQVVARLAERWYARLTRVFDHQLRGRQPLIVYASSFAFQQTNAVQGELGEGVGGVTEPLRRRIVLPIGGPLRETDHVIGHELVHAFQFDITGRAPTGARGGIPAASQLPLWFIEGMAEYLSLGPRDPLTAMWMRDAARHKLPKYGDLEDPRFFPYRFGQALLAYVGGRWGDPTIGALLRAAGRLRSMDLAIRQVLKVEPDSLVAQWHRATHALYDPVANVTAQPDSIARRVIAPTPDEAQYNVSPALSPDGKWLMILSNRDLFSIDLYLADARSGKVLRKVTSTAVDPHFQSLEFINSAGAWSGDSRRFVFPAIADGRPVLAIYDVAARRVERRIPFPDLGEIINPTWSPDGRFIAFSGLAGAFEDLFVYDLQTNERSQITNDPYADLQPAWSPDGRTIAFVTDRFSTALDQLVPGNYQLALLDLATGKFRQPGAAPGKQINPQWAPDGRSLYYVGDPDGISNLYRLDLAAGTATKVTNLYTGAGGVTAMSPALSVAQQSGDLAFTVFDHGAFGVYALDAPTAATARAPLLPPGVPAALLPPAERTNQIVAELLRDPSFGLPPDTAFPTRPYRASLGLEYVGQPTLAVGTDPYGTYVGGGAALYFRDMLGNHNLVAALQANGGLSDVAALLAYQNLAHRLTWGVVVQQQPYVTGSFASGPLVVGGDTVFAEQQVLDRQTNREADLILAYPFNTAQRVEFQAGYRNVSFHSEVRTVGFDPITGAVLFDDTQNLPTPSAMHFGIGSAALVYDNSVFGATSPVLGQRYRLEVTPWVGSLNMVEALADYRRYVSPVRRLTLAFRLLHFGRYGGSSDDPRLSPLFLGDRGLIHGYAYGSFDPNECQPPAANPNACPVFDNLLGSRIIVGNAELRFPLLGVLGAGRGYYGAFPIEMALFADGGVAWDHSIEPTFFGGDRKPVYSVGGALRVNLLGYLVAEVSLAHPFDRPQRDWVWQFSLIPGF